jgi:amino acid adenylation domain-containing protein
MVRLAFSATLVQMRRLANVSKIVSQAQHPTAGKYAQSRIFSCIGDLLGYYGRIQPDHDAVLAPGHAAVTYGMLRALADDTAVRLRAFGIGRRDRVAVVLPDGPENAIALVAVAASAVCVPLNPRFTADECGRYFDDLRLAALLTRADMNPPSRGVAQAAGIPVIDLLPRPDRGPGAFDLAGSGTRPAIVGEPAPGADDDTIILLTSGSTSRPKTVPLTHASICRSAHNVGVALALGPQDRLLNVLPVFHAHGLISGLMAALAAGSSVVAAPGFNPAAFFDWLTEFRPTWYTAVPSFHRAILSEADRRRHEAVRSSLRVVRSASATLPPHVLDKLETLFGVPVIDTFGMTEASSQVASNPLDRRKPGSVGRAAGPEIAIMDRDGRPLPAGQRGEIALRGPTITRGYDNDVAATRSSFRNGWFRTGDLGYLDRDGYLFVVGRLKEVIKRGAQQVAPAEVEQAFLRHPDVVEAVAFSIPHERLGEDVAVAVVVGSDAKVSPQELRSFARERLAAYKVPGLVRIVPNIPKNSTGKVMRGGVAAALGITTPASRAETGDKIVRPRSDLEAQLASIWADLLEVDQIGVDQDVFALGADSLAVTLMLSRLRERFGANLSFDDIFDAPTVESLAARLPSSDRKQAAASPSFGRETAGARGMRLSFQQRRIHVLSQLDPTSYLVLEVARLRGPLDVDALESSIATICGRHEVLRSNFFERRGEPMQRVGTQRPRLERLDLGPCGERLRTAAIRRHAREWLRQPLNIETEPPLRARLVRLGADDHALVIKFHHLVTDGWSQRLFWEEFEALYRGAAASLPELPVQYRNFVAWQRAWLQTRAAEEQLSYWRARLEGMTELPLRTDRPRPGRRTGRGARHPLALSRTLSAGIRSLSRTQNVTLFMTLLAAFQCLLNRYTQHDDVAVTSLIANRNRIETERLIGMLANTIILRTDLSGDPAFSEVLRRVRRVTLDAYRNQDLPIEEILRSLQVPRSLDRNALLRVMFILQNALPKTPALPDLSTQFVDVDPGTARCDLVLEINDAEERLGGWIEYDTDVFEPDTIARMAAHLRILLEEIVADPEVRISRLSLLPTWERRRVLADWNDTDSRSGRRGSFCEHFARRVERAPAAIAVSAGRARLSYGDLARRSSAIAERLAVEGVGEEDVVGLLAERGINFAAAMTAMQRAGAALLPLDPTLPPVRLAQILRHSRARLVVAGRGSAGVLKRAFSGTPATARPQILNLEELAQALPRGLGRPAAPAPSSLACVIYTSGSTGVPKGVMIEHRGLFNHLLSKIGDLELTASDVVAQTAPQSFVISIWQFLAALVVGARVHICADDIVRDPARLMQEIGREGVTVLQIVPSLLREFLARAADEPAFRALGRLRWLVSTGEPLSPDLCRDWFRHFPDVPLMNAYGSTECSDDVATHRFAAPPASLMAVPIGRPVANTRLYVLDSHAQPVPIGVAGELCVGGIGVGRGYLDDPEQTARRFLHDPFSTRRGARMYRTGDLARWRADGTIECLGRTDHQVKIRGCRVELQEIEHVLTEHPHVHSAVVLAQDDARGEVRLVACIVAADGRQPSARALRDFLKTRLPVYMVPAGFIILDRLPLTTHGKVDRPALASMGGEFRIAERTFAAPRNAIEEGLVSIWIDVLKLEEIGVFDDFFELGGHSLLAGQVLARVANSFGVSLPIRALFEAPTVEALARRVDAARQKQSHEPRLEIAHATGDGSQPVSIAQEAVLRIEREVPGLPQFNLPFAWRLIGPLNVPALQRALAEVVRRHDSLRAAFAWTSEQPITRVAPASEVNSSLAVEDLAAGAPTGGDRARELLLRKAELLVEQEAWTPFDITRAPLFRMRLFRLDADDHVLVLILHHIIVDGWSIGVLFEEVSGLYSAFAAGRNARLPELAIQFSDVVRWQRAWCATNPAAQQLAYWREHLRGTAPLFPIDVADRSALVGSDMAHEPVHLPNDLAARLSALGRSQRGSLFMTLLAGFKAMLLARSGRNDICVATAMANRSQQNTERVIGLLENTTIIRTRLDADLSFEEALNRVRHSVLEAHARQELPFDILAAKLVQEEGLDPVSITQAFFILQTAFRPLKLPDVVARPFGNVFQEGQAAMPIDRTWLAVTLKETPSGIIGGCSYKAELFDSDGLQSWIATYRTMLAKAAANPKVSLGRLAEQSISQRVRSATTTSA